MGMENKISGMLEDLLQVEPGALGANTELASLPNWDSLSALQLLMGIESVFPVKISPDVFFECASVEEICAYIRRLNGSL
jgi:acyl carrier protein